MENRIKMHMTTIIRMFLIIGILFMAIGITENVKADMEYSNFYQKVKIKKTGWYTLKNKSKSSKDNPRIDILKQKSKNAKVLYSSKIKKGKSSSVFYLNKGNYYLGQEIGEYSNVRFNKKFILKYKGKNYLPVLKENVASEIEGDILKKAVYVKFKADKTGEIRLKIQAKYSNDQGSYRPTANVTLCNDKKKEISGKTKIDYWGSIVSYDDINYSYNQNFAVTKGKTYYLKLSELNSAINLMYENIAGENTFQTIGSYGFTKQTAVSIDRFLHNTPYKGYIGLNGDETQWFSYTPNDEGYLSIGIYDTLGWNKDINANGFKIEFYDQTGRSVVINNDDIDYGEDDNGYRYTVQSSDMKNISRLYIKITAQNKCPSSYSIHIR